MFRLKVKQSKFLYLILNLFLNGCWSYSFFQDLIPNGHSVQHPCIPNTLFEGVGHTNRQGGGKTNAFGQDFADSGHQWTKALCLQDSDGDGRSNGEELGDPACVWSVGQVPSRTKDITHPGVCEPFHDSMCHGKNDFVSCQYDNFVDCDVIKGPDINSLDLTFPVFTVPPTVTNNLCVTFDLPVDQDYHIVANEGIVKSSLVHHMLLFACLDDDDLTISSPEACKMESTLCSNLIDGWTLGTYGQCYGDSLGFKMGATGYKRLKLEIHYNNPNKEATTIDSSGMRIFYRPVRSEVQELFTLMTGQFLLTLPPGQPSVEQIGVCKSPCTSQIFKRPIYVIQGVNHMHETGLSMSVEVYRHGAHIANLTDERKFNPTDAFYFHHKPPVEIWPGDEIITRCIYDTTNRTSWTYYGNAATDEMCVGLLLTYPKSAFNFENFDGLSCNAESDLSFCEVAQEKPLNGCNWSTVIQPEKVGFINLTKQLFEKCNLDGSCSSECKEEIKTLLSNPCFEGEAAEVVKNYLPLSKEGSNLLEILKLCPLDELAP
ncbi:dopamine beta-hydroxylase-like [Biomphalaria glabrata]|uniref:Dopamine beta-hydroxylase-like n=1 Tax=Biomphalaria glabrata TaxID=6526 RepID=A0A9W3BFL8_BIOGL|nr:dopamine beta-hydroxylase-like [Biomphalaria glabrata]